MNQKVKHVFVDEVSKGKFKVMSACYTDNLGSAQGFLSVVSQEEYPEVPKGKQAVMYFDKDTEMVYYELEDEPKNEE